ncbi:T9SS type A sorting domain-containing protein [Chryseobacterium sp. KACC 21268]|nr:T9SS type A sorting domain-containing protein [Chryseobacterium sp. KACC 21268]
MRNKFILFVILVYAIMINGQTTIWNGSAWSNGVPNGNTEAIIAGNYNLARNVSAGKVTINSGSTFSIADGYSLIIANEFINNGTVLVDDGGILLQRNGSTYSGSGISIVRKIAKLKQKDYNYWSSPVIGQNLYNFSVGTPTNFIYRYNEANDKFGTAGLNALSVFEAGIGYAIRGKDAYSPTTLTTDTFNFVGVPNNGDITVTLQRSPGIDKGYNLVGNPYASNISFRSLSSSTANKNTIFNKQWLWTNLNEVKTQQGSTYAGNNYATYVGGVGGVGPTYLSGNIEEISLRPNEYTEIGQGFIVQAKYNNAPLKFANTVRASISSSSIFYNKKGDEEGDEEEPEEVLDRYWLKLVNPNNVANNILIAHIPEATNDYDEDYDSSLFSLGNDAFYSVIGTNKLQIQARGLPISDSDDIKLGFKNSKAGNCVIALNDKDGVFKSNAKAIYLKDNVTGTITNLQEGYYTFSSDVVSTENETRFDILYSNAVLSTQNSKAKELMVYKNNGDLVVKGDHNISAVEVYDASGKLAYSVSGKSSKEIRINASAFLKGVYILKITSEKGITSKKVIL